MSWRRFASSAAFTSALVPLAPLLLWSCTSDDAQDAPAETGVSADVADTIVTDDTYTPAVDTGPVIACKLDNGTDPFGLCVQKVIFEQWHEAGFTKELGVAESWDSTTFLPDKSATGEMLHQPVDDVRYAVSLARYRISALRYGDTEVNARIDADLDAIATHIQAELVTLPTDGLPELYAALRAAAGGCRSLGLKQADSLDVLADQVGTAIYATYHPLSPPAPSGDAGPDAGDAAVDASTDATIDSTTDVKADADGGLAPIGDGVLGTAITGGGVAYAPADAVTGALALLDMAVHHADDKANAYTWQRAAVSTIDHVHARAREPGTGMYYRAMIAFDGASTDTLATSTTSTLPDDVLLADVQATIALMLSRAQELVTKNKSVLTGIPAYPFDAHAAETIASANGTTSLWDEAGPKGYFEGWVPSAGTMITTKTTRANARFFAAIHRVYVTVGTPFVTQLKPLRVVLTTRIPQHSGVFSTLDDQAAFLERTPANFDFGALEPAAPRERSYFSRENAAAVEALWEQWFGLPL